MRESETASTFYYALAVDALVTAESLTTGAARVSQAAMEETGSDPNIFSRTSPSWREPG